MNLSESQRTCPVCRSASWRALFEQRDLLHGLGGSFTVVQCGGCGLVSYEPFPDDETLAGYYPPDYYAFRQAAASGTGGRLRRLLDDLHLGLRRNTLLFVLFMPLLWFKEAHSYARYLRGLAPGRLLDVGCGDGAFLLKARRMGFECYGMDPGGSAGPSLAGGDVRVFPCSLEAFSGHEEFFDLITLHHVFEHLPRPLEALEKLRSLLAPGGRIIVRMPRTDHFLFRRRPCHWYGLDVPRHVYLYDPRNFERLARRCGLRVETVVSECIPEIYQRSLKRAWFGKPFGQPHWMDSRAVAFALLPVCAALKRLGQADGMALWLRSDSP